MNIKSISLAVVLAMTSVSAVVPVVAHADIEYNLVNVKVAKNIWNSVGSNPTFDNYWRSLGIYAIEYTTENSKREVIAKGKVYLNGNAGRPFPKNWSMIQYLANNNEYDGTVMATNEGDGLMYFFNPGDHPY